MHWTDRINANRRRTQPATLVRVALAVLLVITSLPGCKTCQFPRIDPSGNSIFAPGTTTIDPQLGQLPTPTPAYVTPAAPPDCNPGTPGCKKHFHLSSCEKLASGIAREFTCVGDEGQLQLTPARLIAPVGTEVVLLAGLCGPDKNFVARQPIEWVMSQESTGNFVAVGEDGECSVTRLYKSQPKKTNGSYAVGVSSASAADITRGTPQTNDDFHLGRGQAWLSVTSPSEGTSYVTVLAPKATNWDQRRQTAVIHWVDAQWAFPSPAIVPAGRPHVLTTNVRRAGGTIPATGHIVRYEVTTGEPAGFGNDKQPAVEVPVDAQGNASVNISQLAAQPGVTSVAIQILRPGLAGEIGRTTIGQGYTSITWSAPGLAVKVSGPQTIEAETEATFRIDVSNPGDITIRDVVVSDELPPALSFLGANPPPQVIGNRLEWRLGDITAKTTRSITVQTLAGRSGDIRYRAVAKSADGVQAEDVFASRVSRPSLQVAMTGPPTADVGAQIQYRVEVSNSGDQPLTNVKLTCRFDAGLEQVQGERSPIVMTIGALSPREKKAVGVTFNVRQAGELRTSIEASADGGQLMTQTATVSAGVRRTQSLKVEKKGPAEQTVGGTATYVIRVENTGNTPLSNVKIVDQYAATLEPKSASNGYTVEAGALTWLVPQLEPGQFVERRVDCLCLKPDAGAINPVVVSTREQVSGQQEVATRITQGGADFALKKNDSGTEGRTTVVNRADADAGNINADGKLGLTVSEKNDHTQLGERLSYLIAVSNERAVSDRDVRLRITLSEGLQFASWKGRVGIAKVSDDKRVIEITPIAELRAGETMPAYTLEVTAQVAGQHRVRVEAISQRSPTAVIHDEPTTIYK